MEKGEALTGSTEQWRGVAVFSGIVRVDAAAGVKEADEFGGGGAQACRLSRRCEEEEEDEEEEEEKRKGPVALFIRMEG